MEWISLVVLILLIFAIPELLRSKKQKYEYPEIPDPEPKMYRRPIYYEGEGVGTKYGGGDVTEGKSVEWGNTDNVLMPVLVGAMPHVEAENPWNGRLSMHHVINGVIFAEIVQPPRAKRPIPHWWRK